MDPCDNYVLNLLGIIKDLESRIEVVTKSNISGEKELHMVKLENKGLTINILELRDEITRLNTENERLKRGIEHYIQEGNKKPVTGFSLFEDGRS